MLSDTPYAGNAVGTSSLGRNRNRSGNTMPTKIISRVTPMIGATLLNACGMVISPIWEVIIRQVP